MRASRSCPRSSVPNGCAHEGGCMRAAKSMSLIATRHTNGPKAIARIIASRIMALAKASRWRRNRRQASSHGENGRTLRGCTSGTLPERDARVEPSIEDVRDEVEQDNETGEHEGDRHDHRRVIRENRADQQRSDPGNAEDLLGDDRAAEDSRHRSEEHTS